MKSLPPFSYRTTIHKLLLIIPLSTKQTDSRLTIILVYVDDVILAGNSITEFTKIKTIFHDKFKI